MGILSEEDKLKLEEQGWVVVCESPLEIKHEESNSFASNIAAEMLMDVLLEEDDTIDDDVFEDESEE